MALRELPKCFKLDVSKEVVPYGVYTYGGVKMGAASIQSTLDVLSDSDKQPFLENVEKWDCWLGKGMANQMFDLIEYLCIYCKVGCEVLTDGCCVLRPWLLEHTELDVDSYLTIQPLASSFMLKSGCYENVFQTSGVLQQFISRGVAGGRVMSNSNKMYHVKRKLLISMLAIYIRVPWFS